MTLYLVCHAKAARRSGWRDLERLRPLTAGGHRQARRLPGLLDEAPVTRVIASPHLRCRQTLEPLAAQRGLPIEMDERLAAGSRPRAALSLLSSLDGESAVVCTHRRLIPRLLERFARGGLDLRERPICERGSVWVLEGPAGAPSEALYVLAPARARDRRAPGLPGLSVEPLPDDKERVAVLDLGSTSFHLMVADAAPTGDLRRVLRERVMLRLGAAAATGGAIPEDACVRAVAAAKELRLHAEQSRADRLLPVATSALRDAKNGEALAERIGEVLGAPVRVLSGVEEARLIFAAFRARLALGDRPALGLDLGGGSLELAIGDGELRTETSLPLGVVRLHGELVRRDPMPKRSAKAIRARVREQLAPHREDLGRARVDVAVATGGTVSALARRLATRRTSWPTRAVGQLFVPAAEMRDLARELVPSTHDERLAMPGIARPRADLLPTGAVILDALVEALDLEGFVVSDWGLREGVILESLGLAASR